MNAVQQYLIKNVDSHPKDIIAKAMEEFKLTRAAVYFHMEKLKAHGIIAQTGSKRGASYRLISKDFHDIELGNEAIIFEYEVGKKGEDVIWKEDIEPILQELKQNVLDICDYGFSEMFNNVIDHSKSEKAMVTVSSTDGQVTIVVQDFGIGVFKSIAQAFSIEDMRDAVIKLHQGKVTTDESRHTGQGIFFTSRAFDEFILTANGFRYYKDNSELDDWYMESMEAEKGTRVQMQISRRSSRELQKVFDEYTDLDDYEFNKSHLRISLSKYKEDKFISRSQAKRILLGLKDFKKIVLDFKDIRIVGQAFADEVFGVFGLNHPHVDFQVINANDDVIFMIKKAISDRNFPRERVQLT